MGHRIPVLMLLPTPPPYAGPEVASELLLSTLKKTHGGKFVHVCSNVRTDNSRKGDFDLSGLASFLRVYWNVCRALLRHHPSTFYFLLSSNRIGFLRDALLIWTARAFGAKPIAHYRGANFDTFYNLSSTLLRWFTRCTLSLLGGVIVQSPSLKSMFRGIVSDNSITVLPNGLDFTNFPRVPRKPSSQGRLLFVGHLTFAKGFYDLLLAFQQLRKRHPQLELWCAGEAVDNMKQKFRVAEFLRPRERQYFFEHLPEIDRHIKSALDSKVEGVRYLGKISGESKRQVYAACDIFVLPSYTEGFSMSVLEAMAHGLPVVTTSVGALPDILEEGQNGFLVSIRNPERLISRIEQLLTDTDLRTRMGEFNARQARELYDIKHVADRLMVLLTDESPSSMAPPRIENQRASEIGKSPSAQRSDVRSSSFDIVQPTSSISNAQIPTSYSEVRKMLRGGAHYLLWERRFQWKQPEEIREFQLHRLRSILRLASDDIPFYRRRFQECDFAPEDLNSIDDLRLLPVLTKQQVREHFEELHDPAQRRQAILCQTSGTTGEPLQFLLSKRQVWMEWSTIWRCWMWVGYRPYDRVAAFRHYEPAPGDPISRYERRSNTLFFSVYDMDERRLPEYVRDFNRFGPDVVRGYPSSIYIFASFAREKRLQVHSPKAIITSSETLLPQYRSLIEEVFDCPVYDWYGTNERVLTACQCERRELYHWSATMGIAEYLDVAPSDERYRDAKSLVVTTLTNTVMPLIRYRVEDLVFPAEETCPCGRGLPVLKAVLGRTDDILVTGENKYISPVRFYVLFQDLDFVRQFQVVQTEPDSVAVRISRQREMTEGEMGLLKERLQRLLGERVKLEIDFVEGIEPERSGKVRSLVAPTTRLTKELAAIRG